MSGESLGATYHDESGNYSARILADSIANAVRITTFEVRFPRPYLAEINTHRVFSRNSASSRAIPTEENIDNVLDNPYVPATFNKRVKGMGVGVAFDPEDQTHAENLWLEARDHAARIATRLNDLEVDKSRANRLLEPFMWHTAIITSTEWSNFFALRCPPSESVMESFPAQLEVQQTAILMRRAMRESTPVVLDFGQWHLPLITADELAQLCRVRETRDPKYVKEYEHSLCMISARRTARVSFDKHTDTEPSELSITKAGELARSGHFSPTEHQATPISMNHIADPDMRAKLMVPAQMAWDLANRGDVSPTQISVKAGEIWCGNLRGWFQFRKTFLAEEDHAMLLDYEVM